MRDYKNQADKWGVDEIWECNGCGGLYSEYINGCGSCWDDELSVEENNKKYSNRKVVRVWKRRTNDPNTKS